MFNILVIKEIQIKTTLRFHLTPDKMAVIRKTKTTNAGGDARGKEPSSTVGRKQISAATLEISMEVP
jgi:hypothetical protein